MPAEEFAPLSTEKYDEFVEGLDYPMFIVTTVATDGQHRGERAGCLVGFTTQASIDPPRFLVCLSDKNHTYRVAQGAELLAVHGLDSDEVDIAKLFGGETGDEVDKFAQCSWRPGPGGVPLLDECPRVLVGRVLRRDDWGDHVGFLVEPIEVESHEAGKGLGFEQVDDLDPGHSA